MKTYSDLIKLSTFKERYDYLKLEGKVGSETFGRGRFLNQELYHSDRWNKIRDYVIVRDNGCDLAVPDYEIRGYLYIHHMNPITEEDLLDHREIVLDPEFLICTSLTTHNGIHYGDKLYLEARGLIERTPGDTCLWRKLDDCL